MHSQISPPEVHTTQNLYEAAFCLCKGLKLTGKVREGRKVSVIFEGFSAREIALGFYNGGRIEAKKLTDAYRTLKDYVFER